MAEQQQMTPEQIEQLKEKIKNMSPEELKEFQKKQCVFCHIIAGKVQSKKVYEDSHVLAILDINPANPGHILLLPKEHYAIMPQLPEDELKHIFMVAKSLSNVLLRAVDATGTNVLVANGPAAGQKAQHFMVHIIPRKEEDEISFSLPKRKIVEADLNKITSILQKKMTQLTGKKMKVKPEEVKTESQVQLPIEAKAEVEKKILAPKKDSSKRKKVVEAEFEEKENVKEKTKKTIAKKKSSKKKKDEINLDDIAKVLGVK